MDTGKRINRLLFENHMDQKDLAEALNFTQASMSRWVTGMRIPKSEALCAIADYFDVSVDWLLGRSEYRNYNGFISGDDALEYCRQAKESAWECWYASAKFDATEMPASRIAGNIEACAYFEREVLRWEYDIPRMIHSLVDGTWKEVDRKTEPTHNQHVQHVGSVETMSCQECKRWIYDDRWGWFCPLKGQDECKYEPKTEPQTDCSWK